MASCANCKSTPVSSNCVRIEEEFSFEHKEELNDVLHKLDDSMQDLSKILTKKIDKKWIETEKENLAEYVQELINKMGQIIEILSAPSTKKYTINSSFTTGEKTELQLLSAIIKKLEDHEKQLNNNTSSLYQR